MSGVSLSESEPLSLLDLLRQRLPTTCAGDRRMPLNPTSDDEDVLSAYADSNNCLFGVILCIAPGTQMGEIRPEMFAQPMISIDELGGLEANANSSIYKHCYYFALSSRSLVTTLGKSTSISRVETYLNWLVEETRGETLFNLTPMISTELPIKPKDIKEMIILPPRTRQIEMEGSQADTEEASRTFKINWSRITSLLGDSLNLDALKANNVLEAELNIKFTRPKNMTPQDYERLLGQSLRVISGLDQVQFRGKKGKKYIVGSDMQREKRVKIELTENGHLSEEQLKQEMERYLLELTQG